MTANQVDPWNVADDVDYTKVVRQFGVQYLKSSYDPNFDGEPYDIIERFAKIIDRPLHPLIARGLFFSHKDFDKLLDSYESGKKIFLYTGRGPSSSSMHLGHLIPMLLTQWLQEVFDCYLVIQLTDDEKYIWKDLTLSQARELGWENAKDIIALGFNPNKTFIFRDTDYVPIMYKNILRIQRSITYNTSKSVFGHVVNDPIAKLAHPPIQIAPCLPSSFPHLFPQVLNKKGKDITDLEYTCLIPCAIDQHPYFALSRDVAPRLGFTKPCLIMSKFLPSLNGSSKMSSSVGASSTIFLDYTVDKVESIIRSSDGPIGALIEWCSYFVYDDNVYHSLIKKMENCDTEEFRIEAVNALVKGIMDIVTKFQNLRVDVNDEVMKKYFDY